MKTLLATVALAIFSLGSLPAAHSVGAEDRRSGKERPELSPEIRQQFENARAKALQDPEIQKLQTEAQNANGKFFKAIRKKMIEIDPSLAEVVRKMRARKTGKQGMKEGRKGEMSDRNSKPSRPEGGMGSISPEEEEKLNQARNSAKNDPAVQSAMAAKEAAKTPEERRSASSDYRKAIQAAMLKADPSVEPILKKLSPRPQKQAPARNKKSKGKSKEKEMGGEMMMEE